MEDVGPIDVLLDEQRDAFGNTTYVIVSELQSAYFAGILIMHTLE